MRVVLLGAAVVDDLVALVVIATVYTHAIALESAYDVATLTARVRSARWRANLLQLAASRAAA